MKIQAEQLRLDFGPMDLSGTGHTVPVRFVRSDKVATGGQYFAGPIPRAALSGRAYGFIQWTQGEGGAIVPRLVVFGARARIDKDLPGKLGFSGGYRTFIRLGRSIDPETGEPFVKIYHLSPAIQELCLESWHAFLERSSQPGFWTAERREAYDTYLADYPGGGYRPRKAGKAYGEDGELTAAELAAAAADAARGAETGENGTNSGGEVPKSEISGNSGR